MTNTTRSRRHRLIRLSLWAGLSLILIPTLLQRRVIAKRLARGATSADSSRGDSALALTARIQAIVDDMKAQLGIPDVVAVSLVARNHLVVSVQRRVERRNEFSLQLEQDFVSILPDEELRAVVAHELGHIWISTHHPYLQTEELANEIALRVADRRTLELVYEKVWRRIGTKGPLVYLPVE